MNMDLKEKQIIYVDNKPHIKCGVVMLSTNKKDNVSICKPEQDKLFYVYDWSGYGTGYHLYITSDEEIKEGGHYICPFTGNLMQYVQGNPEPGLLKPIVASTNPSLILPQPPQQFIEKYIEEYNKGNVITEVLVEVEIYSNAGLGFKEEVRLFKHYDNKYIPLEINANIHQDIYELGKPIEMEEYELEYRLKLDSQNQITIRKVKDSWSREEISKIIYSICGEMYKKNTIYSPISVEQWIEENL